MSGSREQHSRLRAATSSSICCSQINLVSASTGLFWGARAYDMLPGKIRRFRKTDLI